MGVDKKELEIVNELLQAIVDRQERFKEALEEQDAAQLVEIFLEEVCDHMMVVPDIVSDPEAKLVAMEEVLDATSKIKMELVIWKAASEYIRNKYR